MNGKLFYVVNDGTKLQYSVEQNANDIWNDTIIITLQTGLEIVKVTIYEDGFIADNFELFLESELIPLVHQETVVKDIKGYSTSLRWIYDTSNEKL